MSEAEHFVETLEERFKIKQKTVSYVIKEAKREALLGDPTTAALLFFGGGKDDD